MKLKKIIALVTSIVVLSSATSVIINDGDHEPIVPHPWVISHK
ncbi:hypothetical protein PV797_03110 [Clostridiaceae bacterium M8S5]|nr:hypothetical protein PV797_03110 [Clostridiaceae bacterium M8S5]